MSTQTQTKRRAVRQRELQKLSIEALRNLSPYRELERAGIRGDATSENPSKAEMIETILDHEIGKMPAAVSVSSGRSLVADASLEYRAGVA
jgi:hypothetical protein